MSAPPRISVVIPLYNKAEFIEQAVHSVLEQDFGDFELLVIDDESTDGSVAHLETAFQDPRMRIIRQQHAGVGAARNRGIREVRGEIVAFLDADDEWLPTHLSDLWYLSRRFPEAGILVTRFGRRYRARLIAHSTIHADVPYVAHNYFAIAAQRDASFIHSSSSAVQRHVLEHVGGFLETTPNGEDEEYWARISLWYPLALHPRVSSVYVMNLPGSATSLTRWQPIQPPVIHTLRDYLERHPDASNANDVLNYAAWILINHAVAGLMSNPRQVRELLADPILGQCRFQRRLRLLRWTSAMPERVARAVVRFHTARWAEPWRSLYARLTA